MSTLVAGVLEVTMPNGAAAPVVLAASHERVVDWVPLEVLTEYAVDVPADPGALDS